MRQQTEILDKLNMRISDSQLCNRSRQLPNPVTQTYCHFCTKNVEESTADNAQLNKEALETLILSAEVARMEFVMKKCKPKHLDDYTKPKRHINIMEVTKVDLDKLLNTQKMKMFNKWVIGIIENS